MVSSTPSDLQATREAVVDAHILAEAVHHDAASTLATFRHPRYEVPALGAIADGPDAVIGVVTAVLTAFPDFYLRKTAVHHAQNAVIVESVFGGTHRGVWAGIPPTGKPMEVEGVLIFVFEGDDLVCEKVYFDHATILKSVGCTSFAPEIAPWAGDYNARSGIAEQNARVRAYTGSGTGSG